MLIHDKIITVNNYYLDFPTRSLLLPTFETEFKALKKYLKEVTKVITLQKPIFKAKFFDFISTTFNSLF